MVWLTIVAKEPFVDCLFSAQTIWLFGFIVEIYIFGWFIFFLEITLFLDAPLYCCSWSCWDACQIQIHCVCVLLLLFFCGQQRVILHTRGLRSCYNLSGMVDVIFVVVITIFNIVIIWIFLKHFVVWELSSSRQKPSEKSRPAPARRGFPKSVFLVVSEVRGWWRFNASLLYHDFDVFMPQ